MECFLIAGALWLMGTAEPDGKLAMIQVDSIAHISHDGRVYTPNKRPVRLKADLPQIVGALSACPRTGQ